jgi:AcrR family transcriptional regulator
VGSRRVARQSRSKETTDAIVEAAARVFTTMGLRKATTTRIAEVAGVSVGSLYQYFPNKQSLIVALFERETYRLEALFSTLFQPEGLTEIPPLVRAYVAATVELYETNRPLYRVLLEEVPRVAGVEPTHLVDRAVASSLIPLLEAVRDRIAPKDLEVAALLLVRTLRYNTFPLLREPLSAEQRGRFIDELTALLCAYLFAPESRWLGHKLA